MQPHQTPIVSSIRWWDKLAEWASERVSHLAEGGAAVRPLRQQSLSQEQKVHQVQFTYSLIALSAKLAAIDGPIVREEFLVFRDVFPMPQRRSHKVRQLFFDASFADGDGLVHARQIVDIFPDRTDLYEEVLERLLSIALADGVLNSDEISMLKNIASHFGIAFFTLQRLIAQAQRKEKGSPYAVLGLDEDTSEVQAKKRYHQLLRDYHPDALAAHGAHPDEYEYYARKAADLNVAYQQISKTRGWK